MNAPKCEKCDVLMTVGIGINPTRRDEAKNALTGPEPYINANTIKLDRVWKCSLCGNSKDIT